MRKTFVLNTRSNSDKGIVDVLLELNKALTGQRMDEWIQLFNVETVDDLKMLETMTKNPGIRRIQEMLKNMICKSFCEEAGP